MLDDLKDKALLKTLKNSAMNNHSTLFEKLVELSQVPFIVLLQFLCIFQGKS